MRISVEAVLFLFFVFSFNAISFSQDQSSSSNQNPENPVLESQNNSNQQLAPTWKAGFQFGGMSINGNDYNAIRLQPEFSIWKFGLGLDLNFEFDAGGRFRVTEWNSWQAVVSKILYLRFGFKREPIYAKVGSINDFTLGNGFIVDRYSNMLNYPSIKKLGFAFDIDFHYAGFESMTDNIFDWDILGLRAFGRPLIGTGIPLLDKLEIGATIAADLDTHNPIPPADSPYDFTDSTNSTNSVVCYGADIGIPLLDTAAFYLKSYVDFAAIMNKGTGEALGIGGSVIQMIPYKLELRILQPRFIPSYFDSYYDAARAYKYDSLDLLTSDNIGWLASTGITLLDNLFVWNVQMEGSFSSDIKPSFMTTIRLSKNLFKIIGVQLTWMRQNISSFSDVFIIQDGNSLLLLTINYFISENLAITLDYKRTFEMDSSGQINPFTSTTISTKIIF